MSDDQRPGRAELMKKILKITAVDGYLAVGMLVQELNSSTGTVYKILSDNLGKRKVK